MPTLNQITATLNSLLANFKTHAHTGIDSPRINYSNLSGTPPLTSPGGVTTDIQYNNAGVFSGTSTITTDGTGLILNGRFKLPVGTNLYP